MELIRTRSSATVRMLTAVQGGFQDFMHIAENPSAQFSMNLVEFSTLRMSDKLVLEVQTQTA